MEKGSSSSVYPPPRLAVKGAPDKVEELVGVGRERLLLAVLEGYSVMLVGGGAEVDDYPFALGGAEPFEYALVVLVAHALLQEIGGVPAHLRGKDVLRFML